MDRWRADDGVSLIEIIVAVVILGISITAILGGLATATKSSALNSERAEASGALTIAAEHLSTVAYVADCSGGDAYESAIGQALAEAGSDVAVEVTVTYWDGSAFGARCLDDTVSPPYRMQLVEIEAQFRRTTETLSVVKRAT